MNLCPRSIGSAARELELLSRHLRQPEPPPGSAAGYIRHNSRLQQSARPRAALWVGLKEDVRARPLLKRRSRYPADGLDDRHGSGLAVP